MIFSGHKILKELRALRFEIAITTAVMRALAKDNGYKIEVTRDEKENTAVIALVREGDNHVEFHTVELE